MASPSRGALRLVRVRAFPVLRALHLGEALFRADGGIWYIVNDGAPEPSIIMGISGKADQLVHLGAARDAHVSLLRRYSGGGTVIADHNTVFASLIVAPGAVPDIPAFPEPIMRWSESFYRPLFDRIAGYPSSLDGYLSSASSASSSSSSSSSSPSPSPSPSFSSSSSPTSATPAFALRENDYVAGPRKFGGNAQVREQYTK